MSDVATSSALSCCAVSIRIAECKDKGGGEEKVETAHVH